MNVSELRYIIAIAKHGSINAAAKALFVAQPNMSKAIQNLENEYGIKIFERTSRGTVPTEEGMLFIAQASKIIEELDKLERGMVQEVKVPSVELRVSIPRASYASTAFVEYVKSIDPSNKMKIHIKECSSLEALNNIIRHDYQLALIRYDLEDEQLYKAFLKLKNLTYEPVLDFEYYLVMSKDSPLAAKDIFYVEELEDYIELLHGDTRLPGGSYAGFLENPSESTGNRRIHVYERGSQFALLKGIKESYMWVSPVPQEVLKEYDLVQKKCVCQEKRMRDVIVYPKHKPLDKEERCFIRYLKNKAEMVRRQVQET